MTTSSLYRLSGLSLCLGSALAFVGTLGAAVLAGDVVAEATNPLHTAMNFVGAAGMPLLLPGLAGVFASQAGGYGKSGPLAMLLIAVALTILGVFFQLQAAVILPFIVATVPDLLRSHPQGPPAFFPLEVIGSLAWIVGLVLLGLPHLRRRATPAWPGYLLIGGAVVEVASFALGDGGGNVVLNLVTSLSALLPFVAFAGLGYRLWSGTADRLTRPEPAAELEGANPA